MKNILFILFLMVNCMSCEKESLNGETPCNIGDCDSLDLLGKLDTIWTRFLLEDGSSPGKQESIIYRESHLTLTYSGFPNGMIANYNTELNGELNWLYRNGEVDLISTFINESSNLLINKAWEYRLSLNLTTGEELEKIESVEQSGPRGELLGDYLYYDERENDQRIVHLRRSHTDNLSEIETIYTLDDSQVLNSKKSITSMNLWLHPSTGDSILIFQHRMLDRVDVVAWNMDKQEVVWRHDDITPNGNSNHQQIFIHEDKAYFGGSVSFYCFDMRDGSIVWQFDDNSGLTPFMVFNTVYAESIDAIIVHSGQDILALDVNTGSIKWRSNFEGSISSGSPVYHNGIIYRTGRGLLYAYRASNGQLLWSERSSRIPLGKTSFQGELAIDRERGILYATDDDELFAIKVYEE